jgi:hypothetical protein
VVVEKELNIHEKYKRAYEELLQRHLCGEIDASEWARRDRAIKGVYLYTCLYTGDQGCNDLLAKMESTSRISASR